MARYTGAVCKLCRREKEKLFLKGSRCITVKCSFEKKSYAPGQHGVSQRIKLSEYGIQLRENKKFVESMEFWRNNSVIISKKRIV